MNSSGTFRALQCEHSGWQALALFVHCHPGCSQRKFKGHWSTYLCTKLNAPREPTHEGR